MRSPNKYDKQMKAGSKQAPLANARLPRNHQRRDDVEWAGPEGQLKDAHAALQLNSYPACPEPDKTMGLVENTDSSFLTILSPGLWSSTSATSSISYPTPPFPASSTAPWLTVPSSVSPSPISTDHRRPFRWRPSRN